MPAGDPVALGQLLRSRRERLAPAEFGLPAGQRRRAAGLRREEVALLASLSTTYYTFLEQGRPVRPSAQVLDALAAALRPATRPSWPAETAETAETATKATKRSAPRPNASTPRWPTWSSASSPTPPWSRAAAGTSWPPTRPPASWSPTGTPREQRSAT